MILLTGATGLVGSHLAYSLLQKQDRIRATHRSSSDLNSVKKVFSYFTDQANDYFQRIDWVEADLTDVSALEKAFKGITTVYHSAAYVNFNPRNFNKLKKSNVEATANMVNLSLDFGVKRFCYVSSIATIGTPNKDKLADESSPWSWEEDNNVYAITKYNAEMEVWRGSQEGLSVVIVNPGVILGAGYWNEGSGSIVKGIARGLPFYTEGGVGFVDVLDVVDAMTMLTESEIEAERFVLVGHNMTYLQLITLFSKSFGIKVPSRRIGPGPLHMFRLLDYLSHLLLGRKQSLFKDSIRSLCRKAYYSSEKIEKSTGFKFRPIQQTVDRLAADYSKES